MGFLSSLRLLLAVSLVLACSWASITPGVAEVDLIFPRNDSYPPSQLIPIVFAIQNPSVFSSLEPRIRYHVKQHNVTLNEGIHRSGEIKLSRYNYTGSDPYFLYWSIDYLDFEGIFSIYWQLLMFHCTADADFGFLGSPRHESFFSIKNGTSPADFVAATEDDTCDQSLAQAVRVPDVRKVPSSQVWDGPSCAATANLVPTPTPCNVKMDSSAAASISGALTSTACANPFLTALSCPIPTSENAASIVQLPVGGLWTLAVGMLLAYAHA
ncbi:hypothetical protein BDV41DRAFT_584409, partial [Aspergillus transmontanensis]